ncbi:pectate lyase [Mangrovibacterium lignilyticum]|uniref:pectate lyase n=1 Tax=Mangrovibacterium lignilyticum TaxID=2668052 RepID=UPI0013D47D1C|nr:pectate lyase [Mangrovibacterium lignilyticum]
MKQTKLLLLFAASLLFIQVDAQKQPSKGEITSTMLKATKYMVEEVSTNGGYLWNYLPDFSRRWGEMEAYPTMIWLQHPGTISMGHLFLQAYEATGEDYYYQAAEKAASAVIWGQSHEGGWNYLVDFAGDRSLKHWYATIGKNGWRLEEFQHYYGNSTFDDDVTSDAARFLLRIYLEKLDPKFKPALDKAIDFILKSQYAEGGWPQRYPLMYDFNKQNHPDYTSFYTFNDDVTWENVHFLIQCYETLGEQRFLDPIRRGMDFYLFSQDGCGAWGQQLTLDMKTAGARTYEPAAFLPSATCENALLLIHFYKLTGDSRYLARVPAAIRWLESVKLPAEKVDGHRTYPMFVDPATQKPIYVHRKGSNVKYGYYYLDEDDSNLLGHYGGKSGVPLQELKDEYARVSAIPAKEATANSPLLPGQFGHEGTPQSYYDLNRVNFDYTPSEDRVLEIINSLDDQNRWLIKHAMTSHPYIGDGTKQEPTTEFSTTFVGDETDTSPYHDTTDQEYISTGAYIRNMYILMNYLTNIK